MSSPVRILVVDDHPAVREGLGIRVAQCKDMKICAEADSVARALNAFVEHRPDIIIVDISLGDRDGDGIALVKQLKERNDEVRCIVWSMHPERLYGVGAFCAGARGYIHKQQAMNIIIDAIREVMAGKTFISAETREALLRRAASKKVSDNPTDLLTARETEVFRMIGQGRKTSEIADELGVSVKTIETHRDRTKKKLRLTDGTELMRRAVLWVSNGGHDRFCSNGKHR